MFRLSLGALALAAALVVPLAASAQSAPGAAGNPALTAPAPGAPGARPEGRNGHHRHHRRHGKGFAHAMRDLNLTADQKTKIAGIMKSSHEKMKAGTGAPRDPQARRANMLALRQQIDGILTPAQRAQLATNLKNGQHHNRDHGPRPMASPQ